MRSNVRRDGLLVLLMLCGGVGLAWVVRDVPLAPGRLLGLVRADALSALVVIVAAGHGLVGLVRGETAWRMVVAAGLTGAAALCGQLGLAGVLLLVAGMIAPRGTSGVQSGRTATIIALPGGTLLVVAGLALIGSVGGEWRYAAPAAGRGLNTASVALILLGTALSVGAGDLARGRAPRVTPLAALGAGYVLLRLFSLGPWNLGWLFATMLVGTAVSLGAAWCAAAVHPSEAGPWLEQFLAGLVLVGAGLGSGAGVVLAGYALLLGPLVRLGFAAAEPARVAWLFSCAMPLGGVFVVAWMAVAAAVAGALPLLAAGLWLAAFGAALPAARLGAAPKAPRTGRWELTAGAGFSALVGVAAPAIVVGLLSPMARQLQGGLTPFGEIELWPWAGLIAFDAARQPVATLPSLALLGLMAVLSALAWVVLRLR